MDSYEDDFWEDEINPGMYYGSDEYEDQYYPGQDEYEQALKDYEKAVTRAEQAYKDGYITNDEYQQVIQTNLYNNPERYARIRMSKAFAQHTTIPLKSGGSFELLTIGIPAGTTLNGQDLSGWKIQQGYSTQYQRQFASESKVFTVFLPLNKPVTLHKYDRDTKTDQKMEVNPHELVTAVKTEQEAYRQEHPQLAAGKPTQPVHKGMSR